MKKIFFVFLVIFLFACSTEKQLHKSEAINSIGAVNVMTTDETATGQDKNQTTFTMEEISQHDREGDCWLLISGKVYDVSDFTANHPGGQAIFEGCGIDATDLYETRPMGSGTPHSDKARQRLDTSYIGDLK